MDVAQDFFYSYQALATLFSVTNKLQMQGDKYLKDLTIRQMLAIPALLHAPDGKATINHVARQLGVTKQSAKQIVESLEKKNYVSVVPSERDKRAVGITITLEGGRAFRTCSERTDLFVADIFHDFTTEDLAMFLALLKKLYRFDGADTNANANPNSVISNAGIASDADVVLQQHQAYLKKRTEHHE